MTPRQTILVEMYKQMFADIDQHVSVVWQSIGAVAASIGLLALAEKNILPFEVGISLIVLLIIWMIANVLEAGYWYNRNLVIIANIERQFLETGDDENIHFYWVKHRNQNKIIWQLKLQVFLGLSVLALVIFFFFMQTTFVALSAESTNFDIMNSMPYFLSVSGILFLCDRRVKRIDDYNDFLKRSPGKDVDDLSLIHISEPTRPY